MKRFGAHWKKMCFQCSEKLLHGHFFFGTKCTNKLVVFYPRWNVGRQQSSHQEQRYHLVPRASGSVLSLFFPTRPHLWQLHACTLAEVKAVTSEGTVKSQPTLDDVGVLPTITQMFPISWTFPILNTHILLLKVDSHALRLAMLEWIEENPHKNPINLTEFKNKT